MPIINQAICYAIYICIWIAAIFIVKATIQDIYRFFKYYWKGYNDFEFDDEEES